MKRDMDLVRNILIATEDADKPINSDFATFDGYDCDQIIYHIQLLAAHGLIDITEAGDMASHDRVYINGLTWDGADYLDAIRDNRVWEKTKRIVKDTVGSTTMSVIKQAAQDVALSMLKAII